MIYRNIRRGEGGERARVYAYVRLDFWLHKKFRITIGVITVHRGDARGPRKRPTSNLYEGRGSRGSPQGTANRPCRSIVVDGLPYINPPTKDIISYIGHFVNNKM